MIICACAPRQPSMPDRLAGRHQRADRGLHRAAVRAVREVVVDARARPPAPRRPSRSSSARSASRADPIRRRRPSCRACVPRRGSCRARLAELVGIQRNPSPPTDRIATKLSMLRTEVAVQAAKFGSWKRKPAATNMFMDRGASGGGGGGRCRSRRQVSASARRPARVSASGRVAVAVGCAAGSDRVRRRRGRRRIGRGIGVGVGVGRASESGRVSRSRRAWRTDRPRMRDPAWRPSPARHRADVVSTSRRKTAAPKVVDVAVSRMATTTLVQRVPARHHTNVPTAVLPAYDRLSRSSRSTTLNRWSTTRVSSSMAKSGPILRRRSSM